MGSADGSQIIAVDQQRKTVKGVVREAPLAITNAKVPITLLVIDTPEPNLLLGTDWMRRYDAELSFRKKNLTFEAKGQKIVIGLKFNQLWFISPNHMPEEYEVNMAQINEVQAKDKLQQVQYMAEECWAFFKIAKDLGYILDWTEMTAEEEKVADDLK